jgi:deoxyribodipyrimidine photolyase
LASDQQEENRRLEEKLATGCVQKIYFQFGSNLDSLKKGLEFCRRLVEQYSPENRKIEITASLFLPTAKLIAQQKFRPWNGVFLSNEFLSGPENAKAILIEMMKIYAKYNVGFLWEAPGIRSEKDMEMVFELTKGALDDWKDSACNVDAPGTKRLKMTQKTLDRSSDPCLLLFGSFDLRLQDNQAFEIAASMHKQVLPVFLWTMEDREDRWGARGAAQVVLKDALLSLESSLKSSGFPLVCCNCVKEAGTKYGTSTLLELVNKTGAKAVIWNREITPEGQARESYRKEFLEKEGVRVYEAQSSLLYDPIKIDFLTGFHGGHWGTLMPFVKSCRKQFGQPRRPTPYHETIRLLGGTETPHIDNFQSVKDLDLAVVTGVHKWDEPIRQIFPMSEQAAHDAMESFVRNGLKRYETERSLTDKDGTTSKLSPHLRIGTLSPNQLFWRIEDSGLPHEKLKTFSRRLFWRDLAYYQLYCFPKMRTRCIRSHYEKMEWVSGEEEKRRFDAWKCGRTGFPIVDAAMRELYKTGWMTQSVRMVVASFLVEYLRVNWTHGCEWFHTTLVDADSAINAMMWQNAGKSGIDQWNFILSPSTASQDPTGEYTRRWVPELANLPTVNLVHRPWEAPPEVLEQAGVILGVTYPFRIVDDLKSERQLSIENTLSVRRQSQHANSEKGYDMIILPNGNEMVVFTKKEYRIDSNGDLLKEMASKRSRRGKK